jgi:hypothetical protein
VGDVCATARAAARVLGFFDSTNIIGCGGILKGPTRTRQALVATWVLMSPVEWILSANGASEDGKNSGRGTKN